MASILRGTVNLCTPVAYQWRSYASRSRYGPVNPFPEHHANPGLWKKVFFFVGVPSILLGMVNTYAGHQRDHGKPRPEFVPYEYLCRRTKRFPWGDGNHGLFHNPRVNPLPTGYETEDEHAEPKTEETEESD